MPAKKSFAAATLLTLAVAAGAAEETMIWEKPYDRGSYQGTPWVWGAWASKSATACSRPSRTTTT
jgi:hypothetical protein